MTNECSTSRRGFLGAAGTVAAASVTMVPTVSGATPWTQAESPTAETLHDVGYALDGAYAVGEDGVLLQRDAGQWRVITDVGPDGNSDDHSGLDATDDGERVWFVGASGTIGEYDVTTGIVSSPEGPDDYSAPDDYTGNFRAVAATGDGGEATVVVTDDSGIVHYSFDNGDSWDYVTPGSGSTIPAVDLYDERAGHVGDTNQSVMATETVGEWSKIGIDNVDENFYGIASNGSENVWVCGNRGKVFDYDGEWNRTTLGEVVLRSIDVASDRSQGLTAGSGGRVFRLGGAWTEEATPTSERLRGVVRGDPDALSFQPAVSDVPDIAVGKNGTIIENRA